MLTRENVLSEEAIRLVSKYFIGNFIASFTTAAGADVLGLLGKRCHVLSAEKNSLAKEITIDIFYFLLALQADELTSASNLTYAIGRVMRYSECMTAKHASYFGRGLSLAYNTYNKGVIGVASTALSFAGSRWGYFTEIKLIESKLVMESKRTVKNLGIK